jgi:hypothetical protein
MTSPQPELTCISAFAALMMDIDANPVAKAHLAKRPLHARPPHVDSGAAKALLDMDAMACKSFAEGLKGPVRARISELWNDASGFDRLGLDREQADVLAEAIACKQIGAIDPITNKPHVRSGPASAVQSLTAIPALRAVSSDQGEPNRKRARCTVSLHMIGQDDKLAARVIQGIRLYAYTQNPWIAQDLSEGEEKHPPPPNAAYPSRDDWLLIGGAFFSNLSKQGRARPVCHSQVQVNATSSMIGYRTSCFMDWNEEAFCTGTDNIRLCVHF